MASKIICYFILKDFPKMYQMIMNYICEFFTRDTLFNQTQYNELGKGSFIIHFFKPLLTHIFQFDKIL